jgi:hypothetical protein
LWPFSLNSSLFCIYFTLLLSLFSFSFPFFLFLFPFFLFLLHFGGDIFHYIDPWNKDDEETETEAEEDDDSSLEDSREESDLSEEEEEILSGLGGGGGEETEELPDLEIPRRNLGSYVVAVYEEEWFLAEISKDQAQVAKGYTRLKYMVKKGTNSFAWGAKDDIHVALDVDIILEPVIPEPVNSRGNLGLKKKDFDKVLSLMVVVHFPFLIIWLTFFPKLPYTVPKTCGFRDTADKMYVRYL